MPSGRLAAVDIQAGINTLIYQASGGKALNTTIRVCNRNDKDVKIRLGLTGDGGLASLTDADWSLEYDTTIRANGNLERFEVSIAGYQAIVGYSDTSKVTFQVGEN